MHSWVLLQTVASLSTLSRLLRVSSCPSLTLLNSHNHVDPTNCTWKPLTFTITTRWIRQGHWTLQELMRPSSRLPSSSLWRLSRRKTDREELEWEVKVMMAAAWSAQFWIGAEQEPLAELKTNNRSKHQLSSHSKGLVSHLVAGKLLPANHSSIHRKSRHWWKSIRMILSWQQLCFNPCETLNEKLRWPASLSRQSPPPTQTLILSVHCKYAVQMALVY